MFIPALLATAFVSVGLAASTFEIAAEQGCLLVVEIFSYEKTNVPQTNFYRPHAAWSVCYTDSPPQEFTRDTFSGDKGDVVIYGNLKPVNDKGKKLIDFTDMCIMGPDDLNPQGVMLSYLTDVGTSKFTFDAAGQMWETKASGQSVKVPCRKQGEDNFAGKRFGSADWLNLLPNPYNPDILGAWQDPSWATTELSYTY